MTIIAGALALNSIALTDQVKSSLRLNLRSIQNSVGKSYEIDFGDFFLTKWDSGAFVEPAWNLSESGCISTLVGDTLLTEAGARLDRAEQLKQLVDSTGSLHDRVLSNTRGTFSIATFSKERGCLELATDMIGLRPIYYTLQNGIFVFASALRIFESIQWILKRQCATASLETCVFGYPLADRTLYEGISVLRECQKLAVSKECRVAISNYFSWTPAKASPIDMANAAHSLQKVFQEGVKLRLGTDRKPYCFLSGGMDSRAIVSSLASLGCTIEAMNFSPDGSQDQVYAELFAKNLGAQCNLHFLQRNEDPNFSMLAFAAKTQLERKSGLNVTRPELLWSGDGGSLGLGHIYMDEAMIELAEKADLSSLLSYYLKSNGLSLPVNVLAASSKVSVQSRIETNALEEINRYPRADGARRIYLFLLFNGQRRHLFKHFQTIDQHGLEFLLPFFDVPFLKMVADTPAKWGILHRLYSAWFEELAPTARSTPWQTYPGHVPCPIQSDQSLSYQWAGRTSKEGLGVSERLTCGRQLVIESFSSTLPYMFSRARIFLAGALHAVGLRDCRHILTMLTTYRQLATHVNQK